MYGGKKSDGEKITEPYFRYISSFDTNFLLQPITLEEVYGEG
jgi:hypothetical protein